MTSSRRELVTLKQGKKDGRYFSASFVGQFTRQQLQIDYAYPAKGRGHGDSYLLYQIQELDCYEPSAEEIGAVVIRSSDFARTPLLRQRIKTYLESADRSDEELVSCLPAILAKVPHDVMRVSEEAIQLDFLSVFDVQRTHEMNQQGHAGSRKAPFTCLDFFAGSGLVSEGLAEDFSTIWANDISPQKAAVFNANHEAGILQICPIENIQGRELPQVELSWGSFPCQDLSLAGDINGLNAARSGLFWQWLRVMDEMPERPPIVVAENVVGLVAAKGGEYYVTVHHELLKRGYRVGAVMLDAVHWLPQSRKRIFVVGVRKDIDIKGLTAKGPTWCHPAPIVNVSRLVREWVWWNLPKPTAATLTLAEIIEEDVPFDSEREQNEKLALVSQEKKLTLQQLAQEGRRVFAGYRRTRNHRQVLEVRTDGIAGCLRTPGGGSSRQILLISDGKQIRTRLLSVREAARLMGAADSYRIPGSYNEGYMAMGDAVAVPVASFLSRTLLAPLARRTQKVGGQNEIR